MVRRMCAQDAPLGNMLRGEMSHSTTGSRILAKDEEHVEDHFDNAPNREIEQGPNLKAEVWQHEGEVHPARKPH